MTWSRDLLHENWPEEQRRQGLSTGLRDLDATTGGIHRPSLWLLIGTPGAGRTTLACQLAASAALSESSTVSVLSARDRPGALLANMLCAQGKVPAHHLFVGGLAGDDERARMQRAMVRLSDAHLRFLCVDDRSWQHDQSTSVADLNQIIGGHRAPAQLLVIDDVDLLLDKPLEEALSALRAWCDSADFSLLLTAPEEFVLLDERVHPVARRFADVVLRLCREAVSYTHLTLPTN